MNAKKLQYYMEHGNIDRNRCIQIAKSAEEAINSHASSQDINELALSMLHCCAFDPDEAAFFRAAVDYVLTEKWGANPKDKAVLIVCMDQQYAHICNDLQPGSVTPISIGKKSSSGCLIILGFIGILPLGFYAGQLLF